MREEKQGGFKAIRGIILYLWEGRPRPTGAGSSPEEGVVQSAPTLHLQPNIQAGGSDDPEGYDKEKRKDRRV
jgi:hypothetical protein